MPHQRTTQRLTRLRKTQHIPDRTPRRTWSIIRLNTRIIRQRIRPIRRRRNRRRGLIIRTKLRRLLIPIDIVLESLCRARHSAVGGAHARDIFLGHPAVDASAADPAVGGQAGCAALPEGEVAFGAHPGLLGSVGAETAVVRVECAVDALCVDGGAGVAGADSSGTLEFV
jgi:hypothetical protein